MTSTEASTGSFPTMGTSAAELNCAAKPQRGNTRPRGTSAGGSNAAMGTKGGSRRATYGSMGATLHPTATLYEKNAASASEGQRHVLMMPSRGSWTDQFRSKAKYGRTVS